MPPRLIALIERWYGQIVADGLAFHESQPALNAPAIQTRRRGRMAHRIGHNRLLRLQARKPDVLRFLSNPAVPFTNLAERDGPQDEAAAENLRRLPAVDRRRRLRRNPLPPLHRQKTAMGRARNAQGRYTKPDRPHPDRPIPAKETWAVYSPLCAIMMLDMVTLASVHGVGWTPMPIRPCITRINRHRGVCPCCRKRFAAPAPQGFDPGSAFGPGLIAPAS